MQLSELLPLKVYPFTFLGCKKIGYFLYIVKKQSLQNLQNKTKFVLGVCNYGSGPLSHLGNIVIRMETTPLRPTEQKQSNLL